MRRLSEHFFAQPLLADPRVDSTLLPGDRRGALLGARGLRELKRSASRMARFNFNCGHPAVTSGESLGTNGGRKDRGTMHFEIPFGL